MQALSAEGVPCTRGYHEQYFDGLLDEAIESRGYKRLFGAPRLKAYRDSLHELNGTRSSLPHVVCCRKIIEPPSACTGASLTMKFKS